MGFKNPIGEEIKAFGHSYQVIGVVRDLVMQSPYEAVRPMIFYIDKFNRVSNIVAKINPRLSVQESMAKIQAVYKKYDAANPFDFQFADAEIGNKFNTEERLSKLSAFFTILAIFISCIGLFGMASFVAEQRIKEIGVRKVLGASVFNLWKMMSKEFIYLVIISFFIAVPLAWSFMSSWLESYQYRTSLSWWIFAVTGVGTLLITVLTVSYQAMKAAMRNPIRSLRTE
jgi:ABC-type antimicrobial peptide transport system permease subunit